MTNCKKSYEAQTASDFKEIIYILVQISGVFQDWFRLF